MKKRLLFLFVVTVSALAVAVSQSDNKLTAKQEKREAREQRRAQKQAAFEKMIDSIVLTHTFQFNPQTMQRQPAGSMKLLSNPNFNVGYWDGTIDVFIPYVKGYTPPYQNVILNYTLPSVQNYTTVQTDGGWTVTFSSSMFTGTTYTFLLEISSRFGGATLTVKNPWYSDVTYTGSISKLY